MRSEKKNRKEQKNRFSPSENHFTRKKKRHLKSGPYCLKSHCSVSSRMYLYKMISGKVFEGRGGTQGVAVLCPRAACPSRGAPSTWCPLTQRMEGNSSSKSSQVRMPCSSSHVFGLDCPPKITQASPFPVLVLPLFFPRFPQCCSMGKSISCSQYPHPRAEAGPCESVPVSQGEEKLCQAAAAAVSVPSLQISKWEMSKLHFPCSQRGFNGGNSEPEALN